MEKKLRNGSIIDIKQTVNGQNFFVILNANPEYLDIRYAQDINRKYEYNKQKLIAPNEFSGEIEYEIVGNIYSPVEALEEHKIIEKREKLKTHLTPEFLSTLKEALRCSNSHDPMVIADFVEELYDLAGLPTPPQIELKPYYY